MLKGFLRVSCLLYIKAFYVDKLLKTQKSGIFTVFCDFFAIFDVFPQLIRLWKTMSKTRKSFMYKGFCLWKTMFKSKKAPRALKIYQSFNIFYKIFNFRQDFSTHNKLWKTFLKTAKTLIP